MQPDTAQPEPMPVLTRVDKDVTDVTKMNNVQRELLGSGDSISRR
jgi:hypothetical protein